MSQANLDQFIHLSKIVQGENPLSSKQVATMKKMAATEEVDAYIFTQLKQLRKTHESLDAWQKERMAIYRENMLTHIPPNTVHMLCQKSLPFIQNMPSSHSKGHLLRDMVNLFVLLHDREVASWNDIELFIGIFAGIFHDIGNAIVDRYAEHEHFCGHAEMGAYLFGLLANNILPKSLVPMIQLAIAAHTHYQETFLVKRKTVSHMRKPYASQVGNRNEKISWALARMTDRMDIMSIVIIIRHIVGNAESVTNFSAGKFHYRKTNEKEEFLKQTRRTIADTNCFLGHFWEYAKSAITYNQHTLYDPSSVRKTIFLPGKKALEVFVSTILHPNKQLTLHKQKEAFEKFYQLCLLLEPAEDAQEKINKLRKKFAWLSPENQEAWAEGFACLTDILFPEWYKHMHAIVQTGLPVGLSSKKIYPVSRELTSLATQILPLFQPASLLQLPQFFAHPENILVAKK